MTTGLLQKMDREELQGVLGHELSHVRNYDIRFTLLVGVLVGGVALLSSFFLRYTFWFGGGRKRDSDSGGGGGLQIVFFVLAIVLAIAGPDRGAGSSSWPSAGSASTSPTRRRSS